MSSSCVHFISQTKITVPTETLHEGSDSELTGPMNLLCWLQDLVSLQSRLSPYSVHPVRAHGISNVSRQQLGKEGPEGALN